MTLLDRNHSLSSQKCLCVQKCSFVLRPSLKWTQKEAKKFCLFGVNLHGKHWADTPRCPNRCGDSPQNKPSNLGQMWGQF